MDMSTWFPEGELHVRGWSARECLDFLKARLDEARKERRSLGNAGGRVAGRMQGRGRLRLSYRFLPFVYSGALVLLLRTEDAPDGAIVRYTTRISRAMLSAWIVLTLSPFVAEALGIFPLDLPLCCRVGLMVGVVLLIAVLVCASLVRGRREVALVLLELRTWFGRRIERERPNEGNARKGR